MKRIGSIYLYHLDAPLDPAHPRRPRHYLGFCELGNLAERDRVHRRGERWTHDQNGKTVATGAARFLQVAGERGIGFGLVRTWRGTRAEERRLKQCGHAPDMCPLCSPRPRQIGFLDEIPVEIALRERRPRRGR